MSDGKQQQDREKPGQRKTKIVKRWQKKKKRRNNKKTMTEEKAETA